MGALRSSSGAFASSSVVCPSQAGFSFLRDMVLQKWTVPAPGRIQLLERNGVGKTDLMPRRAFSMKTWGKRLPLKVKILQNSFSHGSKTQHQMMPVMLGGWGCITCIIMGGMKGKNGQHG